MQHKETQDVIALLGAWLAGGATYEELRRTTRAYMRGDRLGNTIQAIALPPLELALISSARGACFGALDDALKPLLNTQTVLRDWSLAKRWLQREITNAL